MENWRYKLMNEVRSKTAVGYDRFVSLFISNYGYDPSCEREDLFPVFKKRSDSLSVRASLFMIAYEFLLEDARKKNIPFKEIPEEDLINISTSCEGGMSNMYLDNHIYDGKSGVNARPTRNNTLVMSNMQKEGLYDYLGTLSGSYKDVVISQFKKVFIDVDRGQRLDAFINFRELVNGNEHKFNYDSLKENGLALVKGIITDLVEEYPDHEDVIWDYFARIYYLNSTFLKAIVEIIVELTGFPKEEKVVINLMAFAEIYGLILQIVNDVNDFVYDQPTNTKSAIDVMSDLKNHTISLPIIFHYSSGETGLVNKYIRRAVALEETRDCRKIRRLRMLLENKHNYILKEVIESGALIKTQKTAKKLAQVARTLLESYGNIEQKKMLSDLLELANWNRYYYHIKKAKQIYKKGELYICEDNMSGRKNKPQKVYAN